MVIRTHTCIESIKSGEQENITLSGWIDSIRDHGGVYFIDLRDASGKIQLVINPDDFDPSKQKEIHSLRPEFVITVSGILRERAPGLENTKLATGAFETVVQEIKILSRAKTLPFDPTDKKVGDDTRHKYRYLDLRDPSKLNNFKMRSKITNALRTFFDGHDFIDVETPILTKSTPEGARDYLVPSRIHNGEFYALPQSPQLFKQMLMVSGFEKYYQVARCFRDEDLRADRQPEFTQLDVEMSFVSSQDVMEVLTDTLTVAFKAAGISIDKINEDVRNKIEFMYESGIDGWVDNAKELFIPQISYNDAMEFYGSDKPDLRSELVLKDVINIFKDSSFSVFAEIARDPVSNRIKAIVAPGANDKFTRNLRKDLEKFVIGFGAKGLAYFQCESDEQGNQVLEGPLKKFLSEETLQNIISATGSKIGDIIYFGAGEKDVVFDYMGRLRLRISDELGLIHENTFLPLLVYGFPMFEKKVDGSISAMHHPFTMPNMEDFESFKQGTIDKMSINTDSYDLVLNGVEIGGGSIRIHDFEMQKEIFELLELSEVEVNEKFGWFVEALQYGTPPHGGFAIGMDRLVSLLIGLESIKEIIAFPKTQNASCPVTNAPSEVELNQLRDLGLRLRA